MKIMKCLILFFALLIMPVLITNESYAGKPLVSELSQNESSEIELAGNVTHVADGYLY